MCTFSSEANTFRHAPPDLDEILRLNYAGRRNTATNPYSSQDALHSQSALHLSNVSDSNTYPTHRSPPHRSHSRQPRRPRIPAIQQYRQRGHIVDDDRPADRGRGAGQIVRPDQQQQREQLGEARHEQRGRDERRVRVVGDKGAEGPGEFEGEQDADGEVEGDGFERAEGEEEEVLEEDGLGGEEGAGLGSRG